MTIKNIIIGDVHGHFRNLRSLLLHFEAINEYNERINKDSISVYCTGDLIDGGVNRQGDLLLLDYAEKWFDAVVIGNHEYPFFGGPAFTGLRSNDRELRRRLLELEHKGVYVPSTVVDDYLLVHAGLADRWSFQSAKDADDIIRIMWRDSEESTKETPMLDWIGPLRGGRWSNPTGGIFWLDWHESRNKNINQIVGHSTLTHGPVVVEYENSEHWNIDVGGKYGCCLGGLIMEDDTITPFLYGNRVSLTHETEPVDDLEKVEASGFDKSDDEGNEYFEEDETSLWRELMEEV